MAKSTRGKGKEGAASGKEKRLLGDDEPRRSKRKADLPEDSGEEEEESSEEESSEEEEEELEFARSKGKSRKSGSGGSGEASKKKDSTPVGSLRKEQGAARGFTTPVTPASRDDCGSPALTGDADGRFEKESPRTEGGVRTAAKYLVLATLHSNGKGATPYPTEKQYLGMICEYEKVPKWWNNKGVGQPVTATQKKLLKNWAWIKACLSTTFTNTRARLKREATRMFFLLYKVKKIEVDICFTAGCWCLHCWFELLLWFASYCARCLVDCIQLHPRIQFQQYAESHGQCLHVYWVTNCMLMYSL
jgi:hypothetical protein